jgi:hypothetical protein
MTQFEIMKFKREYSIAFPSSDPKFAHKLQYAERKIEHLTQLKQNGVCKTAEEAKVVEDAIQAWDVIRLKLSPKVHTAVRLPMQASSPVPRPPQWSFREFCDELELMSPENCGHFVESSEAHEMVLRLDKAIEAFQALETLPPETFAKYNKILVGWSKGFKALRSRLNMSFGNSEKKGAPASYLAKRATKQANSRDVRSRAQSPKGSKK